MSYTFGVLLTLSINTIQNPKHDGHYMTITTRGGKLTIDPPMTVVLEGDTKKDKDVVDSSGDLVDKMIKQAEVSKIVIPIPRPLSPFPQRFVKKRNMVISPLYHYVETTFHQ